MRTTMLPDRFWLKVDKNGPEGFHWETGASLDPCHVWTAALTTKGYGHVWIDGRLQGSHRLAFTDANGPIAAGLQLDHLCRNHACVNAAHLEAVTPLENTRRGLNRPGRLRVTHCPAGHEFTPANTTTWRSCRKCRACANARKRERRAA